jgi:DUF2934 family protein
MIRHDVRPAFVTVSTTEIADRAYAIFVGRGCQHGFDREDWFQAEVELTTPPAVSTARASKRPPTRGQSQTLD